MAGPSAAERAGRVSDSSPAHVAIPGGTPRSSVYSDRAVFAMSRSPGRSLRPYGSASPPPTTPAAAYARPSDDSRRAYRGGVGVPKTYGLPVTSDIAQQASSEQWRRVRVERDYSQGDMRQFVVVVPDQLVGRIDEQRFRRFIRRLNTMMAEAEGATLRNVLEGCLAYATLYLSTLLVKSKFKKTVERISQFVAHENKTFFEPAGLLVIDPLQTAYMFIEIANI
ncbi:Golgin sub A member 7 [Coemansia sp. RSA 552]|nr:Golgin sub A member 7 [Coemansia sp. RSA 552]